METPVVRFVKEYNNSRKTRFHMPGHKGHVFFGCEPYDITEIPGADVLHHGNGILAESQKNASALFGSGATHYSTEGSSHCIKAMLAILKMERGKEDGQDKPFLLAARNVHRSMVDACALLDLGIRFVMPERQESLCSAVISREQLEEAVAGCEKKPLGVYVTSPDYLGQMSDLASLSAVCKKHGLPLLVDNAHGAYLHFLKTPLHPLDLGAAMCCDSAHKTLPALTGAAYLHIHREYAGRFEPYAAQALAIFGSTSPSYLLLQSLDLCNRYLSGEYPDRLEGLVVKVEAVKEELVSQGICVKPSEPLKIVLDTAQNGYRGEEIAEEMRSFAIECEYADWQNVVLMAAPENTETDWERLSQWSAETKLVKEKKEAFPHKPFPAVKAEQVMGIREAAFSRHEVLPVYDAVGRVCAAETVSCPPAVPIAVCGELITREMAELFLQYGIEEVSVCIF
ncbi:amino acid decarboxylase [bacterium D16-51]|nr:amino acid decarboxylase [bacterium D16-59]RKI60918.1 amino acid decarboxylase [bacterium D16-51]